MLSGKNISIVNPSDSNKSGDNNMVRALKRIKMTCILVIICLLLLAAFTPTYMRQLSISKNTIPDGRVYIPAILSDIISLITYAMMLVIIWYLHDQVEASVSQSKAKQMGTAIVTSADHETRKPTQTS